MVVDFFFVCWHSWCFFFLTPEKEAYRPLPAQAQSRASHCEFKDSQRSSCKHDLTRYRRGNVFPTIDHHLTFTHHFRLRLSPHWGREMRKHPLNSPRLSLWLHLVQPTSCATASRGRTVTPGLLCLSVRRSPPPSRRRRFSLHLCG